MNILLITLNQSLKNSLYITEEALYYLQNLSIFWWLSLMYFSINLDFIQEHRSIYTFICLNQSNITNISQRHILVFLVILVLSTPGNYLKTFTLLSSLLCQSYHCPHNLHRPPKINITHTPALPAPPAPTYTRGIFWVIQAALLSTSYMLTYDKTYVYTAVDWVFVSPLNSYVET